MRSIWRPELLRVEGMRTKWGANQIWYGDAWQRRAGCGPTTCANLVWYLAKSQEDLKALWPHEGSHRANMLRLMEELWFYITPTRMGVDSTAQFAHGAVRFAQEKGVRLTPHILDIPRRPDARPGRDELEEYLYNAFSNNLAVAFLNLDNGALRRLESWHWVTLFSLADAGKGLVAGMLDQGRKTEIDLDLWMRTTGLGGGFVALEAV